jgi:phenylacetate-CoA ligase
MHPARPSKSRPSLLRALAYDVLARRDGVSGWKPHRRRFLTNCQLDQEAVVRLAQRRLTALLRHAYESSPFYRTRWNALGFRPSETFDPVAFANLPFLTKNIIRDEKAAMVSNRFAPADLELSYTGGTTGTQTAFFMDHACKVARVGRQWGIFEQCGYRPGLRRALVWGVHSELPPAGVGHSLNAMFRRYATGDETLCCTIMDAETTADFHARLTRFQPAVLHGYPSGLMELARVIEERDLPPVHVERILTTAERLTPAIRVRLRRAFGGEVFDLYCTREYGTIGFECPQHKGLHIDSESLWIEIVKDGCGVLPGEVGEIVITDLNNYGMPFVRSRTGDIGALSPLPCECGLPWPVLMAVDGRDSDIVFRPDGRIVPALMLTDLLMDFPGVHSQQFVQNSRENLDVLLVVTGDFPDNGAVDVEREVRTLMGEVTNVRVRLVDQLERNPVSGKTREVVCNVPAPAPPSGALATFK